MVWIEKETEVKEFGGHTIPGGLGLRAPPKTVVFVKRVWVPNPRIVQLEFPFVKELEEEEEYEREYQYY